MMTDMSPDIRLIIIGAFLASGLVMIATNIRYGIVLLVIGFLWAIVETVLYQKQLRADSRRVRIEFEKLNAAEKMAIKEFISRGVMKEEQMNAYLSDLKVSDRDTLTRIASKTSFIFGSFSGHYTINEQLKPALKKLLKGIR